MTLYDLGTELIKIRDAANNIEVKGIQNVTMIYAICSKCDNIINEINEIVKNQEASKKDDPDDNKATEVGENSG